MPDLGYVDIAAGLRAVGLAFTLGLDRVPGETVSAWKKRRRARKAHIEGMTGAALSDLRADAIWDKMLAAMAPRGVPTGLRAERSVDVTAGAYGVRVSPALPAGILQLRAKGILTESDMRVAGRFLADYNQAYYSEAGMCARYEAVISGGSCAGGVPMARAAAQDARARMDMARAGMSASCWTVLVQMVVYDVAQVDVSGSAAERYGSAKARRYGVGVLLTAGLETLMQIYG